jgi:hypothetical protein
METTSDHILLRMVSVVLRGRLTRRSQEWIAPPEVVARSGGRPLPLGARGTRSIGTMLAEPSQEADGRLTKRRKVIGSSSRSCFSFTGDGIT